MFLSKEGKVMSFDVLTVGRVTWTRMPYGKPNGCWQWFLSLFSVGKLPGLSCSQDNPTPVKRGADLLGQENLC